MQFAATLEEACIATVDNQGKMTKDLAIAVEGSTKYNSLLFPFMLVFLATSI
jgi:hypothetical protein